ncbi:MAG: carboxymuconolactone decarboxylase family protein [Fimbriimonadaceae bacterium]|nr:carboxymuconolactone decarboxylase family protein [Fimbriimonadaceae bacterium]NUM39973.1 carboxymuconolactone decarboxylase family protein [Armatimonadota bacterium]HQU19829.1 carboxymuconolactone decarboxylase family protein [Fimbriimonadaceae bacterium]
MGKVPGHYSRFLEKHPEVASAYRKLSQAVAEDGPLDPKTCALIKLGMSVAANREGASHSHTRKAIEAGATPDEIRHAVLQGTTTLGFPQMMAGLAWVEDVLAGSGSNAKE